MNKTLFFFGCVGLILAAGLESCAHAKITDQTREMFAQLSPQERNILRNQTVPGANQRCCDEADGTYAEEDIRYDEQGRGHYWVQWEINGKPSGWLPVPDHLVIQEPNPFGCPVVWWGYDDEGDTYFVRCYFRGSGA